MRPDELEKQLASLPPGDAALSEFLRSAAKRAFWFTSMLAASVALMCVVGVAQAIGIRPWEEGWESTATIAAFVAGAIGVILSLVLYSIRHVQMHRATQVLMRRLEAQTADHER